MDNLIKVYDDVIDEVSCKLLIEKFEDSHEDYKTIHQEDGDDRISFEQIILVDHEEWESVQKGMLEVFQDYILHYINDCKIMPKQWPTTYGMEAVRIKRYLPNDFDRFDPHVDVMNYETSRRFLAFFIYLNDVEEGGETEFPTLDLTISPVCGTILVFPSLWTFLHRGNIPISNDKYILGSYKHYV